MGGKTAADPVDEAFSVFLAAVGHELNEYFGGPDSPMPSDVELDDAALTFAALFSAAGVGALRSKPLPEIRTEVMHQAYEEAWRGFLSQEIEEPCMRAGMISWIEGRTGRPLPLE